MNNEKKLANFEREYYAENAEYRKYKRRYAKEYRKKEPVKSKARRLRKAK